MSVSHIDPSRLHAPVLVTGATGRQGGATARALLSAGVPVRALVRDPGTERARAVAALGARLVTGDLLDRGSVARAAEGARAVFSVQMPLFTEEGADFDNELTQATNLVEGAKSAGVEQFVHTSVAGAGQHTEVPGWAEGHWDFMAPSLDTKAAIQDLVRKAGFARWTLIKPGFFMENLLPSMAYLFPHGIDGGLITLIKPDTRLSLTAVTDIGTTAAAALRDPDRFHEVELELASEYRSMGEVAEILGRVLDRPIAAPDLTLEQALAAGMPPMGASGAFMNAASQPGRPEFARALGLPLTSFEDWARDNLS
ncbi:NmrA/HSCARG family protein [Streptomyces sp. NPDC001661]